MAQLNFRPRSVTNWVPASYTANEVDTVINVAAGDLCTGICVARTRTAFNGSGTDAIIEIGDGDDDDRYLVAGDMDETTTGIYRGQGVAYTTRPMLYTGNDTIDVKFTANTAGTRNAGAIDVRVFVAKADPF